MMDQEDDGGIGDTTDEYGELFEGQASGFDRSLSEGDDLNGMGMTVSSSGGHMDSRMVVGNQIHLFISGGDNNGQDQNVVMSTSGEQTNVIDGGGGGFHENVDTTAAGDCSSNLQQNHADEGNSYQHEEGINDGQEGVRGGGGPSWDAEGGEEQYKRIKVEIVKDVEHFGRANINKYLKQNGYRERPGFKTIRKEDLTRQINPVSGINIVSYGPNYETEDIFTELDRFWKFYVWMKARNACMSLELKPMLIPMVAFLFRELYVSRLLQQAFKLIVDFCKRLILEDRSRENCGLLVKLSNIQGPKEFLEDKSLISMYQHQHKYLLSDWTFAQLKRFLLKSNKPVLINLFTRYLIVELRSSQDFVEKHSESAFDQGPGSSESEDEDDAEEYKEAKTVIGRLRGSVQANIPSVITYTTNGWPICGAISNEGSTLAYGMSELGIRVCSAASAKKLMDSSGGGEIGDETFPGVKMINGHEGSVYGLNFHPKTKLLFSVGEDKCMRAWDLGNSNNISCKVAYRGHSGPIWCMDITNSGHLLATGSSDSTARIWIPEKVDYVRILVGHYFDVDSVKFHPNEAYLATGSVDKSIRFWSVSDGKMARIMTGCEGRVSAIAFHSSGKYLAAGGEDDKIRIWDIAEGSLLAALPSLNHCKDLSFNGSMLAACYRIGRVQFWNLRKIVGGDDIFVRSFDSSSALTLPAPCTVSCQASSLVNLYYKDPCNLYCVGSDPPLEGGELVINPWENATKINTPVSSATSSSNYVSPSDYTKFSSDADLVASIISEIMPESSSENNITPEEDSSNYVDEPEGENTSNTITSSDMEFEVDEQMLQSLVDGTLL